MLTLIDALVIAGAVRAILYAINAEDGPFSELKLRIGSWLAPELYEDPAEEDHEFSSAGTAAQGPMQQYKMFWLRHKLEKLLTCEYCQSYYVTFAVLAYWIWSTPGGPDASTFWEAPLYGLAITTAVHGALSIEQRLR